MPRDLESAFRVVGLAKLDPESLISPSQALSFSPASTCRDPITLMEVSPELADQLEGGQTFVFRGDADDPLVLCSKSNVFEAKEAETSNSLLLARHLLAPIQCQEKSVDGTASAHDVVVEGTYYRYLELKAATPHWQKLGELLESRCLRDLPAEGYESDARRCSWSLADLLDAVQASEEQLLSDGLASVEAVEVEPDRWSVLDPDYRMRVVSHICNLVNENSWSWDSVPGSEVVATLSTIEAGRIVDQVFRQFFAGSGRVRRDKLCRFYGDYLLQSSTAFNLDEFRSIWQDSMPAVDDEGDCGFAVDLVQLEGVALVHDNGQIRHFPEKRLPLALHERLAALFAAKDKWTLDEIRPYVASLTTAKMDAKALLTKHARASRTDNTLYFSSKHRR